MIDSHDTEKVDPLKNHIHDIIEDGPFGKKNKTVEDKVRCFLSLMIKHVKIIKEENSHLHVKILEELPTVLKKDDSFFNKYLTSAEQICVLNTKNINEENFENVIHSVNEIMKDDTFIFLLENVNKLTFEEATLIYKIIKTVIILTNKKRFQNHKKFSQIVNNFIETHLEQIKNILIKNLNANLKDFVIIIMGKLFRKLFQNDSYLKLILTKEFFNTIYSFTKNEKFVLSQECFKILFYLISSKRVNIEIVSDFFSQNAQFISKVIISGINVTGLTKHTDNKECIVDDFYYMKRETLIFLEKLLIDPKFENFSNIFLNQSENLKTIMMQLNNKCEKIVFQSIDILYFFFLDIETKARSIKLILHSNKENFYKFFEKNDAILSESNEMMEKKNFILYELERLENYLD